MRVLLDTHTFLWFVLDDPGLSAGARSVVEDPSTDVFVSPASFWEIAIKISLGKYALTVPFETFWQRGLTDNGFHVLPIEVRHAAALVSLPFHHRDPFDRLIVAQAMVEKLDIISTDAVPDGYPIRRHW